MTPIIEHALLGCVFAGTGAWARCMCPAHRLMRIFLALAIIVVEAVVMVQVVG